MEERFKEYLESQFRTIPPTVAAMNYRKQTLVEMLDRAQELKIKGISDENLIYNMVIEGLGDFQDKLQKFASQEVKTNVIKRKSLVGSFVAVSIIALLAITYVLVGVCFGIWHPTWLIMVGGIFAGISVLLVSMAINAVKKNKFVQLRWFVAIVEILFSVFVFLILQLVVNSFSGSWMTFLAMVALLFGVDTAIAFFTNSKIKWIELPIFVEVFFVMVYVILGVLLGNIWHPGWLMCLIGVVVAIVEGIAFVMKKSAKSNKAEEESAEAEFLKEDESYWTKWDE